MDTLHSHCCTIVDLIAANKSSETTALSSAQEQMSYAELNAAAERFAACLRRRNLPRGSCVVLCMERGIPWIVAALGILRHGSAYVPLDPAWPASRIDYVLENSSSAALVGTAALLNRHPIGITKIDPLVELAACHGDGDGDTPCLVEPADLAYVVYTSGSTGAPKGVEITHANLSHLVRWHIDAFHVSEGDRASHLAGLGFDAAVWEIWPTLAAGATLCIPEGEEICWSPESMFRWLLRDRVTISFVPTVHAGPLMKMSWPESTSLRRLLTGGDALHQGPAMGLPFAVYNQYGPSECTVVTTSTLVRPASTEVPAIGRPITGAAVYLLDSQGQRVGEGQVGEIYIGGDGVGRGYRNQPPGSEQPFLADPFSSRSGARMYRSGDLALWRHDGQLEFRGRRDRQVKIRGQRIELDEIGNVLSRHPAIAFAAVMARASAKDEPQLVAYVLFEAGGVPVTEEVLQSYLAEYLPAAMVPGRFVVLERLPLGVNGKVDLKLLPEPVSVVGVVRKAPQVRLRPTAAKVLKIVRDVLQKPDFGVGDNFFLAGGHSLLGMQLTIQLRREFSVNVALRHLFHMATVEKLAAFIETKVIEDKLKRVWQRLLNVSDVSADMDMSGLGASEEMLLRLQRRLQAEFGRHIPLAELRRAPLFRDQAELLSVAQEPSDRLPAGVSYLQAEGEGDAIFWASYPGQGLVRALGRTQPSIILCLTDEDLERLDPSPSLKDMASVMVRKLLAVQPVGPFHLGGMCIGGVVAYEMVLQLKAAGHEVNLLVLLDTPSPGSYGIPHLFGPRLSQPLYLLKRLSTLGVRTSMLRVGERLLRRVPERIALRYAKPFPQLVVDMDPLQATLEAAAANYDPPGCTVKSLLFLAEDRPRHVNFLPGWRALLGSSLQAEQVAAHHSRITHPPVVDGVAATILRSIDDGVGSHGEAASKAASPGALPLLDEIRSQMTLERGGAPAVTAGQVTPVQLLCTTDLQQNGNLPC